MPAPETPYGPAPEVPLHEVEWRIDGKPVQRDDTWRVRYVPYIDARWCAAALDTWVGPQNWKRDHLIRSFMGKEIIECVVSIRFDGEWVAKSDAGWNNGPPDVAIKGSFSDAFKRAACGTWGVGRNVYDLPGDIWAECKVWMRPPKGGQGQAEPVARPHPNAVMQIRQELEKRGHEILHVTAQPIVEGQRVSSDTDHVEEPPKLTEEQVATIGDLVKTLKGETLATAKARLFQEYGKLADLPEDRYDEAHTFAQQLVDEFAPQPPADAPAVEAPHSDEAERQDPEVPPPAPPGPALTAAEVEKMSAKTIAEELQRYGLPLTGKMDEKRKRLLEAMSRTQGRPSMEAWVAGDEFTHHPETAERLFPVPKYIEGIDRYETDLNDEQSQLWEAWMSEHLADATWPDLTQHQAFTAYETIHHLSTKGAMPDA